MRLRRAAGRLRDVSVFGHVTVTPAVRRHPLKLAHRCTASPHCTVSATCRCLQLYRPCCHQLGLFKSTTYMIRETTTRHTDAQPSNVPGFCCDIVTHTGAGARLGTSATSSFVLLSPLNLVPYKPNSWNTARGSRRNGR